MARVSPWKKMCAELRVCSELLLRNDMFRPYASGLPKAITSGVIRAIPAVSAHSFSGGGRSIEGQIGLVLG